MRRVNTRIAGIREGLNDADGQRLPAIEVVVRLADGELSRLPALATELVNNRVDVIVAAGPPAVQAASGATGSIPVIAIDLESDPVASGFIASLARPGGNVTGVFLDFPDFRDLCGRAPARAFRGRRSVPARPAGKNRLAVSGSRRSHDLSAA